MPISVERGAYKVLEREYNDWVEPVDNAII